MKTKKLLSVILSTSMLATSLLSFNVANAEAGDKKVYCYDQDMTATGVFQEKGASHEVKFIDEAHGNAFYVSAPEGASGVYAGHHLATPSKKIENTKLGVSVQVKADYTIADSLASIFMADGSMMLRSGLTGPSTFLMNHWQNVGSGILYDNGKWTQIDLVVDQKEKTVTLYKNGVQFLYSNNATQFETQGLASIEGFTASTYATNDANGTSFITLDNFKAYDIENGDFYVLGGTPYENSIYIDLSASLASMNVDLSGTVMRKVGTNETVEVLAEAVERQIIKVDYSGVELEENAEYEVIFPENANIKDIFGRSLKGSAVFYVEGSGVKTIEMVNTTFGDSAADTHTFAGWTSRDAYVNAPGFVAPNWSEWSQTRCAGAAVDGDNNVLKIKYYVENGDGRYVSGILYDLSSIPDVCDLNISYKIQANPKGVITSLFTNNTVNTGGKNDAWLTSFGYVNEGDNHTGGITSSSGANWGQAGGYTLVSADDFDTTAWYTVESVYHLNGAGTMTADYTIKDADGKVVGEATNKNVSSGFVKPNYFGFRLGCDSSNVAATYALVDDLAISYSVPSNNVKSVRLVDTEGTDNVPTLAPASDIAAINVTFVSDATDVAATLADNSGNEIALTQSGSGSAYSFALETFPKGGREYTFTLTFDGETYEYTFIPENATEMVIKDFNVYKDGAVLKSLENVAAGDEITVKATIINATGKDEEACVAYGVYNDNYLKAVNFSAGDITDLAEGVTLEKTFTVTEDFGEFDMFKGFLTESLKTMKPMLPAVEVE